MNWLDKLSQHLKTEEGKKEINEATNSTYREVKVY